MPSNELQALMDAAVDAVILIDHRGLVSAFNRSAERLFGYLASEVLGRNVSMLMPEPFRSAHDGYLTRYAETGIAHIIGVGREVEGQRKDGSCFPVSLSVGRISGSDPPRFVGFVRDITAQRQAIGLLQTERDRARAYLELFHNILLTVDAYGRIASVNARGCRELDISETLLLGRDWIEAAVASGDRSRARDELAKLQGSAAACTFTAAVADQPSRIVEWQCVALRGSGDALTGLLCSGEDITERLAREEETVRSRERLTVVSRMATMGEMAAGIAHELNQPLTAIANYARACERFLKLQPPDLEETYDAMREIGSEALRAGEIIRRLRRLVRSEYTERTPTDINDVIDELRLLSQADARFHDTSILFDLARDLPQVNVDSTQIQQVLLNLLRNSLEALTLMPAGKRQVVIETHPTAEGEVEVSLSDNGPGVSPEILDHLFEPFCTTKKSGTGLGLAISRTIVHAHGGKLVYRANEPSGASFAIRIPAIEGHTQ